jgi:hypothetical protein
VVAAGIVGRANYGQVIDPSTPAFAKNVMNCEDFNSQTYAEAAQRQWWTWRLKLPGIIRRKGAFVHGPTKAHYRCVCDEAREIEGVIEFEVPKKIA